MLHLLWSPLSFLFCKENAALNKAEAYDPLGSYASALHLGYFHCLGLYIVYTVTGNSLLQRRIK